MQRILKYHTYSKYRAGKFYTVCFNVFFYIYEENDHIY